MTSKASLKRHQKHANYGPFINILVVYMHPCSWSAVSTSVRKILFSQFVPSPLPLPPLGPWHRFCNMYIVWPSACRICQHDGFLGSCHYYHMHCSPVLGEYEQITQECSAPWICHKCSIVCTNLYWLKKKKYPTTYYKLRFCNQHKKKIVKVKIEVCNSNIEGGTMEWSRGTMGGVVMWEWVQHTALNPTAHWT